MATTRNDEELWRKELELTLGKERAEMDQQAREELERVKVGLKNEKRRAVNDRENFRPKKIWSGKHRCNSYTQSRFRRACKCE